MNREETIRNGFALAEGFDALRANPQSIMQLQSQLAEAEARAEKAEAENATLHKELHDVRNECQAVMDGNLKLMVEKLEEAKSDLAEALDAAAWLSEADAFCCHIFPALQMHPDCFEGEERLKAMRDYDARKEAGATRTEAWRALETILAKHGRL